MSIWINNWTREQINERMKGTMCEHIGMVVTEVGNDYITATMPVDARTIQSMGIVHGGANAVLAETVGSIAANMCCPKDFYCVGLEINCNHIRAGRPPLVTGTARPVHVGSTTMVWDIRIVDAEDKLVCVSRLTTAVLKRRPDQAMLFEKQPDEQQAQQ